MLVLSLTGLIGSAGLGFASDVVGLLMFVNGLLAIMMLGMNAMYVVSSSSRTLW